jgi:hypothetical protein
MDLHGINYNLRCMLLQVDCKLRAILAVLETTEAGIPVGCANNHIMQSVTTNLANNLPQIERRGHW